MLTFTDEDGYPEIDGYLSYPDGVAFTINNCGEDCHVLIQLAPSKDGVVEPPQKQTSGKTLSSAVEFCNLI